MSLLCPKCKLPYLRITASKDIDPGVNYDERSIQIVECRKCKFTEISVYEESRRGALDTEIVHHTGYQVPLGRVANLRQYIKRGMLIDIDALIKKDRSDDYFNSFVIQFVLS